MMALPSPSAPISLPARRQIRDPISVQREGPSPRVARRLNSAPCAGSPVGHDRATHRSSRHIEFAAISKFERAERTTGRGRSQRTATQQGRVNRRTEESQISAPAVFEVSVPAEWQSVPCPHHWGGRKYEKLERAGSSAEGGCSSSSCAALRRTLRWMLR